MRGRLRASRIDIQAQRLIYNVYAAQAHALILAGAGGVSTGLWREMPGQRLAQVDPITKHLSRTRKHRPPLSDTANTLTGLWSVGAWGCS